MQYRYVAIDSDGTQTWSDLLTASTSGASGTHTVMKMFANYSPALSAPADNASFDVSDTINFSWNGVSNAISKYVWLYRFSEDSDYSGYVLNGTSLNGVQFNLPGTWYWVVQAYDSDSELIAQSEIRAFTLDDSSSQSSSASRARQSTNVNNVLPVANVLSANVVKAENVTVRSFDSETTESSESIAQQAAFLEEEEMLMFEYWLMGYPMDTHTFPLGCDVLSVEQLSTPEDNQGDPE